MWWRLSLIRRAGAGGRAGQAAGTHAVGDVGAVQVEAVLEEPPPVLRHQAPKLPLHLSAAREGVASRRWVGFVFRTFFMVARAALKSFG